MLFLQSSGGSRHQSSEEIEESVHLYSAFEVTFEKKAHVLPFPAIFRPNL